MENSFKDYRKPENRTEMAIKNMALRMLAGDLDHWHGAWVASDWLSLTDDEKAWHSIFFGYSYRTQWASIAIQLFRDIYNLDIEKLHEWNNENWHRIPVGKDCRYQPRYFSKMVEGVLKFCNGNTLLERLKEVSYKHEDPNKNFKELYNTIKNFPRFGRMTSFLVMQHLYELLDFPISGYEMLLEDSNTWSSRTGLLFVVNREEFSQELIDQILLKGKEVPRGAYLSYLNRENELLLEVLNKNLPFKVDVFNLESEQCETYDKYFLKGREFNFWTHVELSKLTETILEKWKDYKPNDYFKCSPDLRPLIINQFVKRPKEIGGSWLDENWKLTAKNHGIPINLHCVFKDEPNIYDTLNLKKLGEIKVQSIIDQWNSYFTQEEQDNLREKYDPRLYLRWKKNIDFNSSILKSLNDDEIDFIKNLDKKNLAHKRIEC